MSSRFSGIAEARKERLAKMGVSDPMEEDRSPKKTSKKTIAKTAGKGSRSSKEKGALKVLSTEKTLPEPNIETSTSKKSKKLEAPAAAPRKLRFTANLSPEIISRARAASYWVPGLTVSMLVERALEKEIKALETEYNEGKAFKEAGPLKLGRPIKEP